MAKLGFEISATYHEAGNSFAGAWTNENGNEFYEYDFDDENWRDEIDNSDVLSILEDEYENWLQDREEFEVQEEEAGQGKGSAEKKARPNIRTSA